ncbi:MAG: hypothetical protein HC896_09535 [Bacteroidales bacterium]|nr:hypothetical protein [Bacteroidales bacterium]
MVTDTIFYNYQEIVRIIKNNSPKTIIYVQNILPTEWNIYNTDKPVLDSIYVLNDKLKMYCAYNNLIYIDLFPHFILDGKLNPKYNCGDNLHLSGAGYIEWCRLIRDSIYE